MSDLFSAFEGKLKDQHASMYEAALAAAMNTNPTLAEFLKLANDEKLKPFLDIMRPFASRQSKEIVAKVSRRNRKPLSDADKKDLVGKIYGLVKKKPGISQPQIKLHCSKKVPMIPTHTISKLLTEMASSGFIIRDRQADGVGRAVTFSIGKKEPEAA